MSDRKEKSLASLTGKFIEILKAEKSVDLNAVAQQLNDTYKKRRIYDVSNVLEGVGLIKRVRKNEYTYFGKREKNESSGHVKKLQKLKTERNKLKASETLLDKELKNMRSNYESLFTSSNKSYLYVTGSDIKNGFDKNSSVLVAKDFKNIKLYFQTESEDSNLISNLPQVYISGFLVRPVQLKVVNTEKADASPTKLDHETLEMLNSTVTEVDTKNHLTAERMAFDGKAILKPSNQLRLFKTGLKQKSLIDLDRNEVKLLAEKVLSFDKYNGKSKFQYVSDKKLVFPEDYTSPDFIALSPQADEYEDGYSIESPSVHDLYDLNVTALNQSNETMIDEDVEEEYIIEELDEAMMEMLQ